MALEHHFYMDTTASRQQVRDVLVEANIGFEAEPDSTGRPNGLPDLSGAFTSATLVTIRRNLQDYSLRPDNGVAATCYVGFRDLKLYMTDPDAPGGFDEQTVRGVMALLRAFPDADSYWTAYDAELPVLLRRTGQLVLAEAMAQDEGYWDPAHPAYLSLVDLPYKVGPLGPWHDVQT